ncbi:hypothetical protein AeNC1_015274 [Aphanomyces euteiches]|nr:hypothetical protein AeNC1_015274 [Aphanomyces euteiches]
MDMAPLTCSMKVLQLIECDLETEQAKRLFSRLESSNVTDFEWKFPSDGSSEYEHDSVEGMECLLQVLPRTSIKSLTLTELSFESEDLSKLMLLFETCRLETLSLHALKFTSAVASSLATAIQKNETIRKLILLWDECTEQDMRLLIESMGHPSRPVKTKQIQWKTKDEAVDASIVKSLEAFAGQHRCKFSHVAYIDCNDDF